MRLYNATHREEMYVAATFEVDAEGETVTGPDEDNPYGVVTIYPVRVSVMSRTDSRKVDDTHYTVRIFGTTENDDPKTVVYFDVQRNLARREKFIRDAVRETHRAIYHGLTSTPL